MLSRNPNKLLLLDLDGTIRRPKSGAKFINDPCDQEIIPEAAAAAAKYSDWTIVGISNQGGVEAGYKSLGSTVKEMRYTLRLAPWLQQIYFCPDFNPPGVRALIVKHPWWLPHWLGVTEISPWNYEPPGKHGGYRKPEAGMIHAAIYEDIEAVGTSLTHSHDRILMVGDLNEDQGAAQAAKVEFMWAGDWWEGGREDG